METIHTIDLKIVPLKLENVYDLKDWEVYYDPLFSDYNFPDLDDYEVREWFRVRIEQSTSKNFAVLNRDNKTIGLINIKDIRKILKVANLGIVFNPKFINNGYGTQALQAIIIYYFENMNMRTFYLDVAQHNKRAIRCYEKCGFEKIKKYTIRSSDLKINDINLDPDDFIIRDGIVHIYCHKMKLSKSKYIQIIEE